ncbi:MAG: hypothetical protein FWE13_05990 [Firmicutes bacterium]|nr:hypothetical protein [Bacillota bacterium]
MIGDKIVKKKKTSPGKSKTVMFSKITVKPFEQFGIFNNNNVNLETMLERAFPNTSKSMEKSVSYKSENYTIKTSINNSDYIFFSLSKTKDFKDIMAKVFDDKKQEIPTQNLLLEYFTFVLISKVQGLVAYISNQNIQNLNLILHKYLHDITNVDIHIAPIKNPEIAQTIDRAVETKKLIFTLNNSAETEVSKKLDSVLSWTRELEAYRIEVIVKKPKQKYLTDLLNDKDKYNKLNKPKLEILDQHHNNMILDLFTFEFSLKTKIEFTDIDFGENRQVYNKMLSACAQMNNSIAVAN